MKIEEKRKRVRKFVDKLIFSRLENFMADYVANMLHINNSEAEKLLDELTIKEAPLLEVNYKFICPNVRCSLTRYFKKASELQKFQSEQNECPFCGIKLTEDIIQQNTYKIYAFNADYRESRKKNG